MIKKRYLTENMTFFFFYQVYYKTSASISSTKLGKKFRKRQISINTNDWHGHGCNHKQYT